MEMTNTDLLMSKMVANGDRDCVSALAKLLNVSMPTASKKLNGKAPFSQADIWTIIDKYDLNSDEIVNIFFK